MFLSRLLLNPRSRQVRRELSDPYQLHRTIMRAFPEKLPSDERVLFRLDEMDAGRSLVLLVQSAEKPNWKHLEVQEKDYLLPEEVEPNPAIKQFDLRLHAGQQLRFRLRANPTVKKDREGKKQGRRVPLLREEDQLAWLQRKLKQSGAALLDARVVREQKRVAQVHRPELIHKASLSAVRFEGILQVEAPEILEQAIRLGIGSAKGLGFGLLSVAPAREV